MIVDTGHIRFVAPDTLRDRSTYRWSATAMDLVLLFPFLPKGASPVQLMTERAREMRQVTMCVLPHCEVVDGVDPIVLAGRAGARLRSTAITPDWFARHDIATAAIGEDERLEIRLFAEGQRVPGVDTEGAAARLFLELASEMVLAPSSPRTAPGRVPQTCGRFAIAVPEEYERPKTFEFGSTETGETLVVTMSPPLSRWHSYFEDGWDQLYVRERIVRAIQRGEEETLVVERHRDQRRLADLLVEQELNDLHFVREARFALADGATLIVFCASPILHRTVVEGWWSVLVGSLQSSWGRLDD